MTTPPNRTRLDFCRSPPSPLLHGIELSEIPRNKEITVQAGMTFIRSTAVALCRHEQVVRRSHSQDIPCHAEDQRNVGSA